MIEKKEFAAAALDPGRGTFVVYIATLNVNSGNKVYLLKKAQIAHLKADKASSKVPSKYANFANVFSPKLAAKLLKHTRINDHTIELVDD